MKGMYMISIFLYCQWLRSFARQDTEGPVNNWYKQHYQNALGEYFVTVDLDTNGTTRLS